jgi:HK97 family phage prohead protease
MTTIRRTLAATADELGPRQVRVRASTEDLGRDGLVVMSEGIDIGPFRKNPVVLWQHQPEAPVARVTRIAIAEGALDAEIEFAPEGVSRVADEICGLVKSGIVSGLSIGFEPTETEPVQPGKRKGPQRVMRSELLELSFVSIPANRETVVTQRADDSDPKKPYGDVEYADPGYQEDGKKRYPIDTEDHIRAAWNYIHQKKNQGQYTSDQVDKIKAKIIAAWKDKIDKDGPPSAQEEAADEDDTQQRQEEEQAEPAEKERAGVPRRLRQLRRRQARKRVRRKLRGMMEVGQLAWLVESLYQAKVSAEIETALEGDASKLPGMLADVLRDLGETLVAMAEEETGELVAGTEIGPEEALDEAGLDDDDAVIAMAAATPAVRLFRIGYLRTRAAMQKRAGKVLSADTERCLRQMMENMDAAMTMHRRAVRAATQETRDMIDRYTKPDDAEDQPGEETAGEENGGNGDDGETKPQRALADEASRSVDFRRRQAELLRLRAA